MTAFQVAKRPITPKGKPEKAATYLSWLHSLPCCVSRRSPVEAAHVSYANNIVGASGRGKQQKVSDRWAVPLHADLHREQHNGNEREWWKSQGIDPHLVGLVLWGIWNERKSDATERAETMISAGLGRIGSTT